MAVCLAIVVAAVLSIAVRADTCSEVERLHPDIKVSRPGGFFTEFAVTQREYWNKAAGNQQPTCILYPKTTQDVSNIMVVLNQNDEHFAVKGGGHMPNKGFNSIQGGPLIALERMTTLKYDPNTRTVDVGPGNRWHDVGNYTELYGRTTVTGRMGHVGVPGLLLGGGLSFLSTEYGWASTHVLEHEIVLPNGTVAIANEDINTDLHYALRASGGILGIVTRFKLRTFSIGKVWGGYAIYSASHTPAMLQAIRDFTEYYPDKKAALIATTETTAYGGLELWIVFFFYNGPEVPAHVFSNFTRIPHLVSQTATLSHRDLLLANNLFSFKYIYYAIGTETMPLPSADNSKEVMTEIVMQWKNASKAVTNNVAGGISSLAFQPLPQLVTQATERFGGNIMDMGNGNRLLLEYHYSYLFGLSENEDLVHTMMRRVVENSRQTILKLVERGQLANISLPLFANDANEAQDVWGRFGHRDAIRNVRDSVDPTGMFTRRTKNWTL